MTISYGNSINNPTVGGGGGGGASTAMDVSVTTGGFQVITGKNVQTALGQVDTKLALNENYDSILLSLDPLETHIGAISQVPLQSLQTQMHDGRPNHKASGSIVYDEFGTYGVIDTIEGQTANIATLTKAGGGGSRTAVLPLEATTELAHDTIFKAENMTGITLTLPVFSDDFICQVEFTSGASATSFTAPADIKWFGDDTESGALVPAINSRYVLMFYSDGVNMRGISQKVGA